MTEKKKTRSEIKRESIINAAKRAFIEEGIQATSMDKLSEMAQVSKRTVYNHFESKEALVMHIMAEMWRKATVQLDFDYLPELPLQDQLSSILLAEAKMFSSKENIELSRVAFSHFFFQPEALKKEMVKFSARETTLYKWLEAAVSDGRLKEMDFDFANGQLHSMLKGHCFWPLLINPAAEVNDDDLAFVAQETAAMFLSHYQV